MTARRLWSLTKLDAGDYFLPGNDCSPDNLGGTMYRLTRWEDGPHLGAERVRTVWNLSAAPWREVAHVIGSAFFHPRDLDGVAWEHVAEHPTRQAAINEAVELSEARRQAQPERTP